jgi:3-oxoadipate enol-lactonase
MSRLGYDLDGVPDAPVLVVGSSLGTTADLWRPQLPAFSEGHRVLRYDHLGHGRSVVPSGPYTIEGLGREVLALLDELGIGRFDYAGVSLGGMVGMWLAAHEPSRVRRLALLCTSAYLPPVTLWRDRALAARGAGVESIASAVVARWFTERANPAVVAEYRAMLVTTPGEGYAGCAEAIGAMDLRPVLHQISGRTLVIAGADDPATPPSHAEVIVAAIPGATLAVVDGAAHLANVERAPVVTDLLVQHFGEESDA